MYKMGSHLLKVVFFLILFITGLCLSLTAGENYIDFKWLLFKTIDDLFYPIDVEEANNNGIKVTDHEFKCFFQPVQKVYLYLLLRNPTDDFVMIFPDSFKSFSSKNFTGTEYLIPDDGNWMKFNKQPGNYKLYFIATKERLDMLENLINSYQKSFKNKNQNDSNYYKKQIIVQLQQAERDFIFKKNKKKPASIMGGSRDNEVEYDINQNVIWLVEETEDYLRDAEEIHFEDIFINIYTLIYE